MLLRALCFALVLSPAYQPALDSISADALRGDLSFLSSDALEGRDTPSRGLDTASDFIAAEFRKAGLKPGGDNGYFQTADFLVRTPNVEGFIFELSQHGRTLRLNADELKIEAAHSVDLIHAPLVKSDRDDDGGRQEWANRVVITDRSGAARHIKSAAAVILFDRHPEPNAEARPQLLDPASPETPGPPCFTIHGPAAEKFYHSLQGDGAVASIHLGQPRERHTPLRNVVAILPGSDPRLKDTCVILSAHYDHLGMKPASATGDRIYNGANDNGSGTVSVIEIAAALAKLNPHPRRSIIFVTFFGEEEGLLGSTYYSRHPLFPLARTVANLNLEQLGRTDAKDGPQVNTLSMTGEAYSDLTAYVEAAGRATGVKVRRTGANSEFFFSASDNYPLAKAGVPSETLVVAYEFPDYHAVGDEWNKIDYNNLARVDRTIAAATLLLADSLTAPHRSESSGAAPFRRKTRDGPSSLNKIYHKLCSLGARPQGTFPILRRLSHVLGQPEFPGLICGEMWMLRHVGIPFVLKPMSAAIRSLIERLY